MFVKYYHLPVSFLYSSLSIHFWTLLDAGYWSTWTSLWTKPATVVSLIFCIAEMVHIWLLSCPHITVRQYDWLQEMYNLLGVTHLFLGLTEVHFPRASCSGMIGLFIFFLAHSPVCFTVWKILYAAGGTNKISQCLIFFWDCGCSRAGNICPVYSAICYNSSDSCLSLLQWIPY